MRLRFTKMQGAGNDFVVLDATREPLMLDANTMRRLGDRRYGIGADQILVVERSDKPDVDFGYRIFNSTGDEVEQCGNGARCFVRYVHERGLTDKTIVKVETMNTLLELRLRPDGRVTVDMSPPIFELDRVPFDARGLQPRRINGYELWPLDVGELAVLSMGNPHAVQRVEDVDAAPVDHIGPRVERHARFPQKVNAGFMQVVSRERIRVRVYERRCRRNSCVRHGRMRGSGRGHPSRMARSAGRCRSTRRLAHRRVGRRRQERVHDRARRDGLRRRNRTVSANLSEQDIANYLASTPGFFERNAELLGSVRLTSPHGQRAVSLQERQMEMLRDKIKGLELKIIEMIRNGQENVAIADKLHRWTRALMLTADPRDLPEILVRELEHQFLIPQAGVRVWGVAEAYNRLAFAQGVSDDVQSFATSLTMPYCGLNSGFEAVRWLQDPAAIASVALVPLRRGALSPAFGLLVLGSPDPTRYTIDMGTEFLMRIGDIGSAGLNRLLPVQ